MGSPYPLASLPPELLDNILKSVGKYDILSLRLVCHEVLAAVDDVFLDTYFRKRVHMYSRHALQALVDITSHRHLIRNLLDITVKVLAPERAVYRHAASEEEKARLIGPWDGEMHTLTEGGTATNLLSNALRNLSAAGKAPAMIVTCLKHRLEHHLYSDTYGLRQMHHRFGYFNNGQDVWSHSSREYGNVVASILSASAATDFPLKTLDLDGIGIQGRPAPGVTLGPDPWVYHVAPGHCLTVLRLNFHNHRWGFELGQLLNAVTNLEELEIVQDPMYIYTESEKGNLLHLFRNNLSTTKLRSLKLRDFHVPQAEFIALLARFAQTLQDLTLDRVYKSRDDCWRPGFDFMERDLHLEHLQISAMKTSGSYGYPGHESYVDEEGATNISFRGRAAVAEGLLALRIRGKYVL